MSVSPGFLNRFNPSSRSEGNRVSRFYEQLESGDAAPNIEALKDAFSTLVPGMSPDTMLRIREAKSRQELLRIFESVLFQGSYVTLQVKTVFAQGGDDDDDADITAGKPFSVWTPSFDCGVEFQTGETYLVYVSRDEDSDSVETDTCMGTRRLSDAGADLPYLSFLKDNPAESTHLDGFVTSDPAVRANPPETDSIPSPVAGVLVELKSQDGSRYTTSSRDGRFTFDGLAASVYELRAYGAEGPDPQRLVGGPEEFKVAPRSCARHVLLARPE